MYKIWYWRLPSHRPGSRTHLVARGIGPSAISYHLSDGDGATHPSWIIFIKHWQPDRQPGSFRDNNNTYVAYSFFFFNSISFFFFFLINSWTWLICSWASCPLWWLRRRCLCCCCSCWIRYFVCHLGVYNERGQRRRRLFN